MTHVLLYWNHICVLHNQEKAFLHRLTERLALEDIALETRFFGLGYPEHMSEYLAKPDAILPDILVSADLEVFEDSRIFGKLADTLHPTADWLPLRQSRALELVARSEKLLPILAIPLVYYTRQPSHCAGRTIPSVEGLTFGGINNSAGKTLVKAVWSHYGRDAAARVLRDSAVTDMPIGAFQGVRMGQASTALVPSLYALRADGTETHLCCPEEGPLLIPSYLCARTSLSEALARRVVESILCPELCNFYATNGDLILFPSCTEKSSAQESTDYLVPLSAWYDTVSPEEFYELYSEFLPTAHIPFA